VEEKAEEKAGAEKTDNIDWGREGLSKSEGDLQQAARRVVRGIARFKVHRAEFDEQARALQQTNVVYKEAEYKSELVASWCANASTPTVPPPILDSVVAVPVEATGDVVVARGPAEATAAGTEEAEDADARTCQESRYVSALNEEDIPGLSASAGVLEIASLMGQLEELDATAQRSVAKETEYALESGAALVDEAGRERILELCRAVRKGAKRLVASQRQRRLQTQLARAALGQESWQQGASARAPVLPHLEVPRGTVPLSFFDWRIWAQARPTLWRYGDGGHLDPKRDGATQLRAHEWISCLCLREEMEYTLPSEGVAFRVRREAGEPEVNRFASDWVALHMFATLHYLTERHQSAFAFLKNGGMRWAEKYGISHQRP
jgi:hypothetical protein